eukprot:TRINITY_DN5271_c0_g1_i1.p1 TRINITY_DN5271_c0_g1~~TRINITY_DN5271_c0_g1_i1.p1  ORF type:complete len:602 (-),score=92.37 TRINITY_DN5271_c0_g1_i1:64-1770(-)
MAKRALGTTQNLTLSLNKGQTLSAQESEREQNKFRRDVRRAFQICAAQIVSLIFLAIIYYTYEMLQDHLYPFLWALFFSVLLRKPKTTMLNYLDPLKQFEVEGFINSFRKKLTYLWNSGLCYVFYVLSSFYILLWVLALTNFTDLYNDFTVLLITTALIIFLVGLMVSVAYSNHDSYESLVATILAATLVLGVCSFVVFFLFKAVQESVVFFFDIKTMITVKANDPYWTELLAENGITPASIEATYQTGREMAENWATNQGYNLTEISETISFYVNRNSTELVSYSTLVNDLDFHSVLNVIQERFSWEHTTNFINEASSILLGTGVGFISILSELISPILGLINNIFAFVVFLGALVFLVESETSLVDTFFEFLPVPKEQQEQIALYIQGNISQIFVCSFLLCFSHGFFTWLFFTLAGMDFAYSAALITGLTAIFPFVSPWFVYGPALLIFYLKGNSYVIFISIFLYFLDQIVSSFVDDRIFQLIPHSQPYVTGLSMVLGVSTFGIAGILVGPLLVVMLKTFFQLYSVNTSAPNPQTEEKEVKDAQAVVGTTVQESVTTTSTTSVTSF